jgi:site-specific recombinase XerD
VAGVSAAKGEMTMTKIDDVMCRFDHEMRAKRWSDHTRRAYARGLHFFVRWLHETMDIHSTDDVTIDVIAAWRDELERWNVSPATRELRFAAVKSFFRVMRGLHVIDVDPARPVPFPQRRPHVDDRPVLARDEVDRAIANIDERSPIALRDRAILEVLVVTGIRNSELRALTIDDVDFEDRTLLVRQGKGRKMRIVPIGRAAAALERYVREARSKLEGPASADALFLSRERTPLARKTLESIVRRRVRVAPHGLRHACATSMYPRRSTRRESASAARSLVVRNDAVVSALLISVHRERFRAAMRRRGAHRRHTANRAYRTWVIVGRRVPPACSWLLVGAVGRDGTFRPPTRACGERDGARSSL